MHATPPPRRPRPAIAPTRAPRRVPPAKALRLIFVATLVLLLSVGALFYFGVQALARELGPASSLLSLDALAGPPSDSNETVTFVIQAGETTTQVAERLAQQGLVRSALVFRLLVRQRGADGKLQAGEYQLRRNMSAEEIITVLQRAVLKDYPITFVEGRRLEEYAETITGYPLLNPEEFLTLARGGEFNFDFLSSRPPGASLEGYLYPDTYRISERTTTRELIEMMLRRFDQVFTPEMREEARARGLTIHQVLTIASIVEREAVVADEAPLIAGVYYNRLKQGMLLNADPTVQYALGYQEAEKSWWKKQLLFVDLDVRSPYNTYRNGGLPPGPICNPGLRSIQAALRPQESEYLYFVARGDGTHVFARTLAEHTRNQQQFQGR